MIEQPTKAGFYGLVPKGTMENAQFRLRMIEMAKLDPEFRQTLWDMSAKDCLFWINTFVMTIDYRPKADGGIIPEPFNTYPFQDEAIKKLCDAIGMHDILIEKSRDQGASWIILLVFIWRWLFFPSQKFMLVSGKESMVDSSKDMDALFPKIDFVLSHLPTWMVPSYQRVLLRLYNYVNGSLFTGTSTTGNVSRGGRMTAVMLDEFAMVDVNEGYAVLAATQKATTCRIFNSTPNGMGNAFADMAHNTAIEKLRMHWSDHPIQGRGLYTSSKDLSLELVDKKFWAKQLRDKGFEYLPDQLEGDCRWAISKLDYPFKLDSKLRNPYYDAEEARTPSPMILAKELGIDYLASAGGVIFDPIVIDRHIREYAIEPYEIGHMQYDETDCSQAEFVESGDGKLSLWCNLNDAGKPPRSHGYVLGVDVSYGTGATPACISVVRVDTGHKVAQFRDAYCNPSKLAETAVALCNLFSDQYGEGAFLVWEAQGPGIQFSATLRDIGYGNIYYHKQEQHVAQKRTGKPGWYPTKDGKKTLLQEYHLALARDQFVNRSKLAMEEARLYVFGPGGEAMHPSEKTERDPSGAKENHGDMVIADALAWRGCKPLQQQPKEVEYIPVHSLAGRRNERKRLEVAANAPMDMERWG